MKFRLFLFFRWIVGFIVVFGGNCVFILFEYKLIPQAIILMILIIASVCLCEFIFKKEIDIYLKSKGLR